GSRWLAVSGEEWQTANELWVLTHSPLTTHHSRQPPQDLDAALQGFIAGGVADAEMSVGAAEGRAGDEQEIVADGFGDEVAAAASRRLGEEIERPARLDEVVDAAQAIAQVVALAAIVGDEPGDGVIARAGGQRAVLHHAGSADERKLLEL